MGIYDRDYYRREGHSYLGSFTERGKVCKALIVVNVVVFVAQLLTTYPVRVEYHGTNRVTVPVTGPEAGPAAPVDPGDEVEVLSRSRLDDWLAVDKEHVLGGQVWRLVTYAFLHDVDRWAPWHIIFNMLALWWFGTDVEDLYGPKEFLAMYLVAAFLGGVAFVVTNVVTGSSAFCVGASGAVMAVMVLCAIHYPLRRVLVMWLIPVPLWLCVVIAVGADAYYLLRGIDNGTAVSVHLAGAGFAYLYYKFHWNLTSLWAGLGAWRWPRRRPRLRVYRDDEPATPVSAAAPAPARDVDEHLEAKVDAVLEKVSRHGQDSLTDSEREILFKASEVYKKRRT
jgi:membrane associated rhomboid family serine protease